VTAVALAEFRIALRIQALQIGASWVPPGPPLANGPVLGPTIDPDEQFRQSFELPESGYTAEPANIDPQHPLSRLVVVSIRDPYELRIINLRQLGRDVTG
jgi:hypothetical protein